MRNLDYKVDNLTEKINTIADIITKNDKLMMIF